MALQNLNGKLIDAKKHPITADYQGVFTGRSLNFTFRILEGELVFPEPSYFHIMACMRKLRMKIPMEWTPEFFYAKVDEIIKQNTLDNALIDYRIFARKDREPGYLIQSEDFNVNHEPWSIEVFKELKIEPSLIQAIPTPKAELEVAKTFAQENNLDDLLFINSSKKIAHTLYGNLFALIDNQWVTNRMEDGAIDSVWRNQLVQWSKKKLDFKVEEKDIIAFALQKADECFILVDGKGIYPVKHFRNKTFEWVNGRELVNQFTEEQLGINMNAI